MTKEMKYLLFGGMALFLLAYAMRYTPAPKEPALGANATAVVTAAKALAKMPQEKNAVMPRLRDPFRVDYVFEKAAPTTAEGKAEGAPRRTYLALQGIFSLPNQPSVVIIDDKMYSVGQKIYGWTITKIYSDRVILSKSGKMKTLKLRLGV